MQVSKMAKKRAQIKPYIDGKQRIIKEKPPKLTSSVLTTAALSFFNEDSFTINNNRKHNYLYTAGNAENNDVQIKSM